MEKMKKINAQIASRLAANLENSLRELRRCGAHRSNKATLVEMGIQLSGFKNDLAENNKFNAMISNAWIDNDADYQLPAVSLSVNIKRQEKEGLVTYILNNHSENQRVIMYITGGAYVQRPDKTHWQYLNRLAVESGAKIYVPLYSLIPQATYRQAYQEIAALYNEIYNLVPASQITIMGDSAGGGLATGFCEYLGKKGLPQPGHLILFSPWLDLDLGNPLISKYEENDVTLAVSGLRKIGTMWAGNTDHRDYRLSPLYGNFEQLRDVMIFVGTKEILYPDTALFVQKLREAGVVVKFCAGRGLFHSYPLYQIPESKLVMKRVVATINN
ncbi:alpha/beta hydrolase fold domain-containing protein [Limosilactobacillus albertensis]|uniref:Alpha/beta hydrolase n=1 Tax=Limosilactobacillus albertensis TaxID=2759752 RepID=A0A839GZR0_9LACO|nr:alpha/beta hydrolase [Limosilactobacillus albertensis]MBB1123683.1 alpha/beta hydrolase [Limosilactobacillus albertensis]MCD7121555.1 alpha/beta hydrolase [Limosilactobacillus albertensis]